MEIHKSTRLTQFQREEIFAKPYRLHIRACQLVDEYHLPRPTIFKTRKAAGLFSQHQPHVSAGPLSPRKDRRSYIYGKNLGGFDENGGIDV